MIVRMYTNIPEAILYDAQKTSQILLALQAVYTTGTESNSRIGRNCHVSCFNVLKLYWGDFGFVKKGQNCFLSLKRSSSSKSER